MQIASYWASLGFRIDQKELRKVDSTLKTLETKLSKFSKKLEKSLLLNIKIDQRQLNSTLGNALDKASNSVVFEISRFSVNQRNMQAALLRASRSSGQGGTYSGPRGAIASDRDAMFKYLQGRANGGGQTAGLGSNTYITQTRSLSPQEWNRREQAKNEEWNRRRAEIRADEAARRAARGSRSSGGREMLGAGGAGGLAARAYAPAIALAGGAYGVGWLNKRNQEVQSAELGANAVVQGGRGAEAMAWLKAEADRIGFDWLQLTPSFTGFMGAAQGTMGYEGSLNTFKAFNEFATSRHAPTEARKKALYGLQQMASMPNLMSQELFLQVGEAQGFGEVPMLFAQAYAEKMNSGLTGKEALYALKTAMKKGDVKTADVLPRVTELLSQKAAPTLAMSAKSSMSEQSRYNNALNEQVVRANKAGVETGYARLFRAFTDAMKESTPVVEGLAKTFDEISKYVSFATLLPQSFKRAFEGRDSWVADALGTETIANLKSFISGMSDVFSELKKLTSTILDGWDMLVPSIVAFANKVADVFKYTFKMFNALLPGGEGVDAAANYGRAMQASLAGKTPEEVAAIAAGQEFRPNVANPLESAYGAMNSYNNLPAPQGLLEHMAYRSEQSRLGEEYRLAKIAETQNKDSIYYNDPKGFDAMVNDRMKAQAFDQAYRGGNSSQVNINSGAIVINANTSDPEALSEILTGKLRQLYTGDLEMTKLQFPQGE